jgi:sensor histidine kinase YesM
MQMVNFIAINPQKMAAPLQRILSPRYRLLSHLLFWIVYMLYFTLLYGSFSEDFLRGFREVIITLPVKVTATYFSLYFLVPRFLDAKRYPLLILLFLGSAVFFGYVDRILMHLFYVPIYIPDYDYVKHPLTDLVKALQRTTSVYIVVFAAVAIKLIKRNYQNERLAQELGKEKLDAELKFLKGQIHPHFLFNTMNTLYALTLQNSPMASEVVLKLSNFLDYLLYDCNVDQIALRREIQQMQNLIELEQLRYGNRLDVSFSFSGDIGNQQLPPLLMLPFVENAFKHGVSKNIEDAFISIDLNVTEKQLVLRVENSKGEDSPLEAEYTKGIGLKNVQRRLELLFGNRFDLQIFNEEDTFMIVLKIPAQPNLVLSPQNVS